MLADREEILRQATIGYFDETSALERRLETVAELCKSATDEERLTIYLIQGVGDLLTEVLIKKRICDHFFFGRTIEEYSISDVTLAAEIYRLDETHESVIGKMVNPPEL